MRGTDKGIMIMSGAPIMSGIRDKWGWPAEPVCEMGETRTEWRIMIRHPDAFEYGHFRCEPMATMVDDDEDYSSKSVTIITGTMGNQKHYVQAALYPRDVWSREQAMENALEHIGDPFQRVLFNKACEEWTFLRNAYPSSGRRRHDHV